MDVQIPVDLEKIAPDVAAQVANLERAVACLQSDSTFENAKLFCVNSRFAWMALFTTWRDKDAIERRELIRKYVAAMKLGRMFLSLVNPKPGEESRLLPHYMRNCTARWDWARMLMETEDIDAVRDTMTLFLADLSLDVTAD